MQGPQATGLDLAAAFLADPVLTALQASQCFRDGNQLILSSIVYRLQGLVVLQLDRPIAPIADQRLDASLQVGFHPLVALDQGSLPGEEGLFDVAKIVLCKRHGVDLTYRERMGKMACRLPSVSKGPARGAPWNPRVPRINGCGMLRSC